MALFVLPCNLLSFPLYLTLALSLSITLSVVVHFSMHTSLLEHRAQTSSRSSRQHPSMPFLLRSSLSEKVANSNDDGWKKKTSLFATEVLNSLSLPLSLSFSFSYVRALGWGGVHIFAHARSMHFLSHQSPPPPDGNQRPDGEKMMFYHPISNSF